MEVWALIQNMEFNGNTPLILWCLWSIHMFKDKLKDVTKRVKHLEKLAGVTE